MVLTKRMDAARLVRRAAATAMAGLLVAAAASANPISDENALTGTDRWDLAPPPQPAIEGYSTEPSAAPGDTFHLHVWAPGADLDQAVELTRLLEWACTVYWRARMIGDPSVMTPEQAEDVVKVYTERNYGRLSEA